MSRNPESTTPSRFAALLEPVLQVAHGLAQRFRPTGREAEAVVEEVALEAYRGFDPLQEGTRFKVWFLRLLTQHLLAGHATRAPVAPEQEDASPLDSDARETEQHAAVEDPTAVFLDKLDSKQVATALETLPEELRIVTALYFLDDLGYQDIADIVSSTPGTVRSRLHRGRGMLRRALWSMARGNGIAPRAEGEGI